MAALATGTAGCISALPPLGSQIDFGRVTVPDPPYEPRYRRWAPPPGAFPGPQWRGIPVVAVPSAFASENAPAGSPIGLSILRGFVDYFGIGFEQFDLAAGFGDAAVLEGGFDVGAVEDFMSRTGYEPAGSRGEFALYDRPDGNRIVAIREGTILFARRDRSHQSIEYLLELRSGNRSSYGETDSTFARFTDRVGLSPSMTFGFGVVGKEARTLHSALSFRFDDEATYYVVDHMFAESTPVSREEARRQLREAGVTEGAALLDVETDGQFAAVELRIDRPIDDGGPHRTIPQITWGWDLDRAAETVTVRHEAGDSFPAEHAVVEYDDVKTDAQFSDEYDTVEPGDSITVDLSGRTAGDRLYATYDLGDNGTARLFTVDTGDSA